MLACAGRKAALAVKPENTVRRAAAGWALLLMMVVGSAGAEAKATPQKCTDCSAARALVEASKSPSRKKARARPVSLALVSKKPSDAPDFDYRQRLHEAQALLAAQPVLPNDMQFDGQGALSHFTWLLAVGRKDGPLTILRMDEAGKNDQGYAVTWPADNFINTHFRVTRPDGQIVFAQRRPVHAKVGYQEAVYSAYAPELDTKIMRDAGMNYLQSLQRQAYDQIKANNVQSRVAPGTTVADEIPQSMVLRLMITEHVDPLHMKFVGMEQCVHEVLFTLAANGGQAYAYAKSSAGALGLSQFVEGTYAIVQQNYPAAHLEPDFASGMVNLNNAVMASVLLLDLELTSVPKTTLKQFTDSSQQFSAFLAAGYNRNPVHVLKTYYRTHSFTGGHAPVESKMYVRIQDWIGNFLKKEYGLA
jgi:hypothetical protein